MRPFKRWRQALLAGRERFRIVVFALTVIYWRSVFSKGPANEEIAELVQEAAGRRESSGTS